MKSHEKNKTGTRGRASFSHIMAPLPPQFRQAALSVAVAPFTTSAPDPFGEAAKTAGVFIRTKLEHIHVMYLRLEVRDCSS